MGFFEGAHNFEIYGGNFIDMRGGHIQYNTNMMNIRGNNITAAMNPVFNPGGPPAPPHDPRYGPTQSNTSTYPGYAQSGSSYTNSSYTHSSHPNPPRNSTMYPAAGQQNGYCQYQASQFMQAQYQSGQHPPPPYPPGPGQQSYQQSGQQSHQHPSQPGQQPYHPPSPPGQQPYPQPSQPEPRSYSSPSQHGHQSYHYPPPQQNTTTIHQYQQVFHNSRVGGQRDRSASPSSTDSEDPDVTEIRENFERQDIS